MILSLIKQCTNLEEGRRLHLWLIHHNALDRFATNLLIHMYGSLGSPDECLQLFNRSEIHRNSFSWNSLLRAFLHNALAPEAGNLFSKMPCRGLVAWNMMLSSQLWDCHQTKLAFDESMLQRDVVSWTCMLTAYAHSGHLDMLLVMFEKMPQWDLFACNAAIPCFDLFSAADAFEKMPGRDLVSWNTLLQSMFEKGGPLEVLNLVYDKMPQHSFITWTSMITALAANGHLPESIEMFKNIQQRSIASCNAMIIALARTGKIEESKRCFERMPTFNVLSWTSMLQAYSENGHLGQAMEIFDLMPEKNHISWTSMLSACVQAGDLLRARMIFQRAPQHNRITWNSMLSAFSCDKNRALRLFEVVPERDAVSWNEALQACSSNESDYDLQHCRLMFKLMPFWDSRSWVIVIKALVNHGCMDEAKAVFQDACDVGVEGTGLRNIMILGSSAEHSKQIFDGMSHRDGVTWNCLLQAYSKGDELQTLKSFFDRMPLWSVISWAVMISALGDRQQLDEAKGLFEELPERDLVIWTTMLSAFAQKREALEHASVLFDRMPEWDIASVTAMIQCYAQSGHIDRAREMFDGVPHPDAFTLTVMITAYGQQGFVEEASELFGKMPDHQTVITYNSLLGAFMNNDRFLEAMKMFAAMDLEGVKPNLSTYTILVEACTAAGDELITLGKLLHSTILEKGIHINAALGNSLVALYGKCGLVKEALDAFVKVGNKDRSCWNSMASSFGWNGRPGSSSEILKLMLLEGVSPDSETFLALLTACNHAGSLTSSFEHFREMISEHFVEPTMQHYLVLVDSLGRLGMLQHAEDLIQNMPFESQELTWTTLLGACKTHGDAGRGVCAANNLVEIDPSKSRTYKLLLSSIHVSA